MIFDGISLIVPVVVFYRLQIAFVEFCCAFFRMALLKATLAISQGARIRGACLAILPPQMALETYSLERYRFKNKCMSESRKEALNIALHLTAILVYYNFLGRNGSLWTSFSDPVGEDQALNSQWSVSCSGCVGAAYPLPCFVEFPSPSISTSPKGSLSVIRDTHSQPSCLCYLLVSS